MVARAHQPEFSHSLSLRNEPRRPTRATVRRCLFSSQRGDVVCNHTHGPAAAASRGRSPARRAAARRVVRRVRGACACLACVLLVCFIPRPSGETRAARAGRFVSCARARPSARPPCVVLQSGPSTNGVARDRRKRVTLLLLCRVRSLSRGRVRGRRTAGRRRARADGGAERAAPRALVHARRRHEPQGRVGRVRARGV